MESDTPNEPGASSGNPFSNIGQDIDDEKLLNWNAANKKLVSLVQMSDEEEAENGTDVMISDALLATGDKQQIMDTSPSKPSTSLSQTAMFASLPANMDLTLQYLSGKITFIEFSEQMEQENELQEIHVEIMASEQQEKDSPVKHMSDSTDTPKETEKRKSVASPGKQTVKRKNKKPMKRKCDVPSYLQASMGEANMSFALGNHEEAIKQCLEIIRQAPYANKPFHTLGMIYDDMGDIQKALQYSLIAAYLDPTDGEEWARLAGMCLEQDDTTQAAKCYTQAIAAGGVNKKTYLWERSKLYESMKEHKKALEGYQTLLPLLSENESEKYFKLAWGLTRNYHESGEKQKALDTMNNAFHEHPELITSEDVNMLLELQIPEGQYKESLAVLVKHCGLKIKFIDNKMWSSERDMPVDEFLQRTPVSLEMPDMLPVDLQVKLAVCLIHCQQVKLVEGVLPSVFECDIENNGDLYLDIAEAFMETDNFKHALPVLKKLVHSKNYNLAAVWLKYGECLSSLKDIYGAVQAYIKVVKLAPSHIGAKMSLAALQQQLGKHDEALETLQHEEVEERKLTKEEQMMLLQKCHLLRAQGKLHELLFTAKQLIFQEWRGLEAENMNYLQAIRRYKHRKESVLAHFNNKGKDVVSTYACLSRSKSSASEISYDDLWDMFYMLCKALIEQKMYPELEEATLLGMMCPLFSQDEKLHPDFEWLILIASLISRNPLRAYAFGRHMVIESLECIPVWNMFMQVIMVCSDGRHNRFLMRKMLSEPNNIALGIMNGHTSMSSGSYKHSLGEYATVFKRVPTDPMISLCIGLDFIHIASQRFSAKRHYLISQAMAFFHNYLELRGECQESYYNIGRALHQINIPYAAIHYYTKALELAPCIGEKGGQFDLSREIAFNLSLIYQSSGCLAYARHLLYQYCTI